MEETKPDSFLDNLGNVKELADIPIAPQPAGLLTNLLPYQLQGLFWMIQAEHPLAPKGDKPVQFWKRVESEKGGGSVYYLNIATNSSSDTLPSLARGGVLADDSK